MGLRSASFGLAALAAVVVVGTAGSAPSAGPPTGAALAALSQLPSQSSLASQRIYFVMPDRYANGSTDNDTGGLSGPRTRTGFDPTDPAFYHGGDLTGLTQHLQRIKDLGFTALWVTPVVKQDPFENGSASYHGYWGLDFTTVDPHLGSDADFAALVGAAHGLDLKVYLDVVVNHTADVVQLTGTSYSDVPYRDCHGKRFNPARYVTGRFPCLKAANMPRVPFVVAGDRDLKKPAWLNDPLNYHDRGNIDFGSCSDTCFEQGDFYGLDDLFTEKPNVQNGLAQIYAEWITRFHVDGFRVDTAKHVNAAFFRLWVPKIRAAAKAAGISDFPVFGEVTINDATDLSYYVRDRGLPQVLDFPFQEAASGYASGAAGARGIADRLDADDYFRTANGVDPAFTTFLGNHDMGRAAQQILSQAPGLSPSQLLQHVLLGYDLLYLLRGAPAVLYGDEVGMIGSGGDQQARQDMFPTQVADWQTQARVGGQPIGKGTSFDVTQNPIEAHLKMLAALRDAHPELATGASVVRYAKGPVLVVSRIDLSTRRETVVGFNNGDTAATVTVPTASGAPLKLTIQPVSSQVVTPGQPFAAKAPGTPALTAGGDPLTSFYRLGAAVPGGPASVAFAVRRHGGAWQRVAIDDSAPYRAYLEPAKFGKRERVQGIAVARGTDGSVRTSRIVTFVPNP
ncbi:MAG TPA: alpha-amylase family glycosyl hydrolase [Gaiellaceae bacterium]|nr:alpha-amylase family glycosyl hydrolase [Gaiellaceae bacterium]